MAGVCEGECMEHSLRDEPPILMRCHSCGLPKLYGACEGWKFVCGRAYNLKGIFQFFLSFLALLLFYSSSFLGMMCADSVLMGGGDSIINISIWNATIVLLVLSAFDDTTSLGSPH